MKKLLIVLIGLALCFPVISQEDDTPTPLRIPDLSEMSLPRAVAELNRLGLELGEETVQLREGEPQSRVNQVIAQTPTAGTLAEPGDTVDVTVLRAVMLRLVFDDNDITFINPSGSTVPIGSLTFRSVSATPESAFNVRDINDWEATLDSGDCYQLWSVGGRRSAKAVSGCPSISQILWAFTGDRSAYFWTGGNGATAFEVTRGGVTLATCPIADQVCEVYTAEFTDYIYLTYTADQLVIHNTSEDGWMLLNDFDDAPDRIAPGQCVVYTTDETRPPLTECDIVQTLTPLTPFWETGIDITGTERVRTCPAPIAGESTVCLLAR